MVIQSWYKWLEIYSGYNRTNSERLHLISVQEKANIKVLTESENVSTIPLNKGQKIAVYA